MAAEPPVPHVEQPVTDDPITVRPLTTHPSSWIAAEAGQPATWTLQLVLDESAWEEVLNADA